MKAYRYGFFELKNLCQGLAAATESRCSGSTFLNLEDSSDFWASSNSSNSEKVCWEDILFQTKWQCEDREFFGRFWTCPLRWGIAVHGVARAKTVAGVVLHRVGSWTQHLSLNQTIFMQIDAFTHPRLHSYVRIPGVLKVSFSSPPFFFGTLQWWCWCHGVFFSLISVFVSTCQGSESVWCSWNAICSRKQQRQRHLESLDPPKPPKASFWLSRMFLNGFFSTLSFLLQVIYSPLIFQKRAKMSKSDFLPPGRMRSFPLPLLGPVTKKNSHKIHQPFYRQHNY